MSRRATIYCMGVALAIALVVFTLSLRNAYDVIFFAEAASEVGPADGVPEPNISTIEAIGGVGVSEGTLESEGIFGATSMEIRIVGSESAFKPDRDQPYNKSGLEPIYNIEGIDVITAQILEGIKGIVGTRDDTEKAQSALKITNLMGKELARSYIKDTITMFDGELWQITYGAFDDTSYAKNGEVVWALVITPETSLNDSLIIVTTLNDVGIVKYKVY